TLGVRFHRSPPPPPPTAAPRSAPLVPAPRGDSLAVRFRMPGAPSVALAGAWNARQPVRVRRLGAAVWAGTVGMRRGVCPCNRQVDRSDWVVPNGVATVPDGLGGMVAVLVVP